MFDLQKKYGIYFICSLALHFALFFILFTQIIFSNHLPDVVKQGDDKKLINAVAVNQQQVATELQKLKSEQALKKQAEQQHIRQLQQMAAQAKARRLQEQQQLAKLRSEQQQMHQKQLAEQKAAQMRLAELKKQQALQKQKLAETEKQSALAKQHYEQEQQKMQDLKKRQALAQQKKQQDAQALLQQQMAQEQQQLQAARAQYVQGVVNKYNALIIQAIKNNWQKPLDVDPDSKAIIQIRLAEGGKVLNASIIQSSGNPAFDRTALTAVYKASPLPVPSEPDIFNKFRQFSTIMQP